MSSNIDAPSHKPKASTRYCKDQTALSSSQSSYHMRDRLALVLNTRSKAGVFPLSSCSMRAATSRSCSISRRRVADPTGNPAHHRHALALHNRFNTVQRRRRIKHHIPSLKPDCPVFQRVLHHQFTAAIAFGITERERER